MTTRLFDQDITAKDIESLAGLRGPLGPVTKALIQEWTCGLKKRMNHPRIGTVYGERNEEGTFSLRIVFRHSTSVESQLETSEEERQHVGLYEEFPLKEVIKGLGYEQLEEIAMLLEGQPSEIEDEKAARRAEIEAKEGNKS